MGVDFGSKLAGTTAACWLEGRRMLVRQSEKRKDADAFLGGLFRETGISKVFMDAPLSLPGAYLGQSQDYFFREADRQLNAMSPMFLGGLTARAMKLRSGFPELHFFETYPRQLVRELGLERHYRKDSSKFLEAFSAHLPFPLKLAQVSWHGIDSVLAWYSGYRHNTGQARSYGNADEGLAWI